MTEQMDHRAAIEIAAYWVKAADVTHAEDDESGVARCYLASIKAAWPGVVPPDSDSGLTGVERRAYGFKACGAATEAMMDWCCQANKFERDYPGLKVDDPWLVTVMEGVK